MITLTREACDGVVLEAFLQVFRAVRPMTPEVKLAALDFQTQKDAMDVAIALWDVRNKIMSLFRSKLVLVILSPNQLAQKLSGPVEDLTVGSVQEAVWLAIKGMARPVEDDY